MVPGWNDARHARGSRSDCGWWACTTAPVAVAALLPGRRGAAPWASDGDDEIAPRSVAEQTHSVSQEEPSRAHRGPTQTGLPGLATCTRCAGSEPVCPVSVSGAGSTGRSSSSSSSSSSGDNSSFPRRRERGEREVRVDVCTNSFTCDKHRIFLLD